MSELNVRRPRRDDERGFTLVIFALSVVVLMIFVAFAIDIGAGLDERREDVSAADGSVLGSIVEIGDSAKVSKVVDLANSTLDESLTQGDFNTCAGDTGALTIVASGADCISFNTTRTLMRVRIPTRALQYFGGVAGLPDVEHSAAATARIFTGGFGGVLPFKLLGGDSGHTCLRSDSGGTSTEPCAGGTSGSFGEADFSVFSASACAGNSNPFNDDDRLQFNTAEGVDHELGTWSGGPVYEDRDVCVDSLSGTSGEAANAVRPAGGLTSNKFGPAIMHGFTLGGTGYDGRLERSISGWWGASGNNAYGLGRRVNVNGSSVDSVALWEFMENNNSSTTIPGSCRRNQFADTGSVADGNAGDGSIQGNGSNIPASVYSYVTTTYTSGQERMRVMLERCFAHFRGATWDDNGNTAAETRTGCTNVGGTDECTTPLFTRTDGVASSGEDAAIDLQLSPRFGYAPVFDDDFNSNNEVEEIVRFRAVFIYRSCGSKCSGPGANVWSHDPGSNVSPPSGPSSNSVGDLTGFVFSDNMLPEGLAGPDAPFDIGTNRFVELVR